MQQSESFSKIYRQVEIVYRSLPDNGKPDKENTFTVLAGIVAVVDDNQLNVVPSLENIHVLAIATGTKCSSEDMIDIGGIVLHDSHAEVLARRAFVRYVLQVLVHLSMSPEYLESPECPLEKNVVGSVSSYRWKSSWHLYLCISDSPCGDATIYPSKDGIMTFTGAKLAGCLSMSSVCANSLMDASSQDCQNQHYNSQAHLLHTLEASSVGLILRESGEQQLSVMRLKTGRSDIRHRSQSKSCSDKICRWRSLGLQGQLLFPFVGKVPLHGVIVAEDPYSESILSQKQALERALISRLEESSDFSVCVLPKDQLSGDFKHSKSNIKREIQLANNSEAEFDLSLCDEPHLKRRKLHSSTSSAQCIPCSFSINWCKQAHTQDIFESLFEKAGITKKKKLLPAVSNGKVEVTVAQTGLLQGSSAKFLSDPKKAGSLSSRLSRRNFYQILQLLENFEKLPNSIDNGLCDYNDEIYYNAKLRVRENHPILKELHGLFFGQSIFQMWHSP